MSNIKLRENIYWIGAVDWDIRNFHGYATRMGSTYNSYIILDEKIAVVDSVKNPFADELLCNILEHAEFEDVDYVICNHAEPDHSGSLQMLMDICSNAKLVCNEKCKKTLSTHYDTDNWDFVIVDESTEFSLGKHTLKFLNTPMAHWPESMMTYVIEEKLLFSMDAFGQHFASSGRFDYEEPLGCIIGEAKKYYANILMLYDKPVAAALQKASALDIEIIAPSHGIIWTKHIPEIINSYKDWIVCKPKPKVLIFFDTMWKSTGIMADAIYAGADIEGIELKKYDLKFSNITDIATETIDAAVLAVGSPTLNKGLMPKVAEVLTYLRGLSPKGKAAIAFGAYGWAKKGGQHQILDYLKEMNCEILLDDPVQSQYVPNTDVLEKCNKAGKMLAKKALDACGVSLPAVAGAVLEAE